MKAGIRPPPAYLQRLERVRVRVAVQDDVVGHAEALPDSQVVEERELAEGIGHLHHGYICRQMKGAFANPAIQATTLTQIAIRPANLNPDLRQAARV